MTLYRFLSDKNKNHKDYRLEKYRLEGFYLYYKGMLITWDMDPAYPLLSWIMDELALDTEERYWLCFLYGHFYHVACAYWVLINFPDFHEIDFNQLKQWEKENYNKLLYQDDRIRERGHFAQQALAYKNLVGDSQEDFFRENLTGDKYKDYMFFYNKIREKIKGFGRYTTFYYLETLVRCMDLPISAPEMFLKEADSPRQGLEYLLYGCVSKKPNYTELNKKAEWLLNWLKEKDKKLEVDYMFLETVLCAYKGLWKGRRYLGYYIDRSQEEIIDMEIRTGEDFSRLWQARQEIFPDEFLGEINGWRGRREHLYKVFKYTGRLVNIEYVIGDNHV